MAVAREGETEKRARGLFPARPTSGKTPLIGTWLPVGATNSAGGGREGSSSASATAAAAATEVVVAMAKETGMVDRERKGSSRPAGRRKSGPRGKGEEGAQEGGGRACSAHSVTLTGKPY